MHTNATRDKDGEEVEEGLYWVVCTVDGRETCNEQTRVSANNVARKRQQSQSEKGVDQVVRGMDSARSSSGKL
jgi:hypothetical protein